MADSRYSSAPSAPATGAHAVELAAATAAAAGLAIAFLALGWLLEQPLLGLVAGFTAVGVIGLACALLGIPALSAHHAGTTTQRGHDVQNG
nr:hypothetical protein [Rhodococcus sp. (in: high G+C Gram-positive bacteria)]